MEDYKLVINYCERGHVTTKRCNEELRLYPDLIKENFESRAYQVDDFFKDFKKSLRLFNSNSIFDVEITLSTYWDTRYLLIRQGWTDKEAGVFEVYDYTDRYSSTAKVTKMSKDAVIKRFKEVLNQILKENDLNIAV